MKKPRENYAKTSIHQAMLSPLLYSPLRIQACMQGSMNERGTYMKWRGISSPDLSGWEGSLVAWFHNLDPLSVDF